jgi:hypothetical protein
MRSIGDGILTTHILAKAIFTTDIDRSVSAGILAQRFVLQIQISRHGDRAFNK